VASISVAVGGIVPVSFSPGGLTPSPHPSLVRSMKSSPTLLPSFSFSILGSLVGQVGGGSILLLLGDEGGMGIP
jgi:hypothetical protein